MLKKWIAFIVFVFIGCCADADEQELLKTHDISRIMEQILSQHVNKKEVTAQILQHAFEIYIEQFDPHRIYLLQSEASPYFQLSSEQLRLAIEEYKKNNFGRFEKLNELIQKSIERARAIRVELINKDKNLLFYPGRSPAISKNTEGKELFASTKEELKERILENWRAFYESQKRQSEEAMALQKREQLFKSYEARLREFENQYLYQNDKGEPLPLAEQQNLFSLHVLKALANSLDAHTSFYKTNEAYDIRVRLQKEFKGIGLVFKDASQGIVVTHLLDGGSAADSKQIELGDILIEVDGKPITNQSFEKTMDMLHGDKNTDVSLTFKRKAPWNHSEKIYTVKLKRQVVILNKDRVEVQSQPFGNGVIGMISLHAFYQGDDVSSEQDVKKAIAELKKKGDLKGLILDLRENSGGFLSQAVKVAGLFISDGVIVISKYSHGEEKIYRDVDGKAVYEGPLIVLVSKATASAAEIVAQALQDYGVALVVGDEHTYGKGTIQTQTVTDSESASFFKVTVGKYYTVSGKTPQKEGVKADILVPGHWNKEQIGEMYADTLDADVIPPAYNDSLSDIPPGLRPWYIKYYIPKLQKQTTVWRNLLPALRKNSDYRIGQNKNYQFFLKGPDKEENSDSDDEYDSIGDKSNGYGEDDLQVQEAFNILKDMVLLAHTKKK